MRKQQQQRAYIKRVVQFIIIIVLALATVLLILPRRTAISYEGDHKQDEQNALDLYITELISYECENCPERFRTLDVNNKYSYGCLQFQEETFRLKARQYNLFPESEDHELMNLIYECDVQRRLAYEMFINEPDAYRHWKTSIIDRGLGMPPTIIQLN